MPSEKWADLEANPPDALELKPKPKRDLPVGVSLVKSSINPYLAQCRYKGKPHYIGSYPSVDLAKQAFGEKMAEFIKADPKPVHDLPDGVSEGTGREAGEAGTYRGQFTFHRKTFRT